jgi:ankyrin repeat protein
MNISIVVLSLKYLNEFSLCVKLSKWIYEELVLINYCDIKLKYAYKRKNIEIFKYLINLVKNKRLLDKYLFDYVHDFEIFKLLIDNGADINYKNILKHAYHNNHYNSIKLLIDNGADIKIIDLRILNIM